MNKIFFHIVLIGLLFSAIGCSTSSTGTVASGTTGTHALVGTWSGTWTDTIYNVSGTLTAAITQSGSTLSGTGTIGVSGLGFPTLGDEGGTASGTIDGENVTFTFSAGTLGSGSGTVMGTTISGTGEVAGVANYGAFTFSGTRSGNTIEGMFDFTSPTGGEGTATVTKQ